MIPTQYQNLAPFYDRLMNKQKYSVWAKMVKGLIKKYSIKTGTCLDLACGTGTMSAELSKLGFFIIGIDISKQMLNIAKEKNPGSRFIKADIRDFSLRENEKNKIVIATCFFDSLNYLSKPNLLSAFRTIASNLPKGAIFIFDTNTRDHVENAQSFPPAVYQDRDVFCVFRYGGKGNTWNLTIDGFIRKKDDSFRYFTEHHSEKGYDPDEIISLLKKTEFKVLEWHCEMKKNQQNQKYKSRSYFVVQKR